MSVLELDIKKADSKARDGPAVAPAWAFTAARSRLNALSATSCTVRRAEGCEKR